MPAICFLILGSTLCIITSSVIYQTQNVHLFFNDYQCTTVTLIDTLNHGDGTWIGVQSLADDLLNFAQNYGTVVNQYNSVFDQ